VDARRGRFDCRLVADVDGDHERFAAQALYVATRALQSIEAAREQGDAPAVAGELPGDRPADAGRGTRHDDGTSRHSGDMRPGRMRGRVV
jgi:hypothetical protein